MKHMFAIYLTIQAIMIQLRQRLNGGEMGHITFQFNQTKAIEAILYLATKIRNPGKYVTCKLLYLADKCSLERYGRFIFGESYSAMLKGAIPSNVYDLLKEAAQSKVEGIKVNGSHVIPLREPDLDSLSESDIECLEETINKYAQNPDLMRIDTHDAAWQESWDKRGDKGSATIPVESIAKLFTDSDDLLDYLTNCNG